MSYLQQQEETYNNLAHEFQQKQNSRLPNDRRIVNGFYELLVKRFKNPAILDLGPGNGNMSKCFAEKGLKVTAVEISQKMAEVAQKNCPELTIIRDEFLRHNFDNQEFDGILAVAFIHLFNFKDRQKVLLKIRRLLSPCGLAYISTTKHPRSEEGFFEKTNFVTKNERLRKRFTRSEFLDSLDSNQLHVVDYSEVADKEEPGKVWMNAIAELATLSD